MTQGSAGLFNRECVGPADYYQCESRVEIKASGTKIGLSLLAVKETLIL
jgi:hypothetical protein